MAVIKIVPMPGAVGDKGDEGAPGPQGPQGQQGLQGPAGADALWNYNGEYNPGAGYAVGDVVTYQGQTWYRKHANGGNVGDTPSEGLFWDLIAAKGSDITTSNIFSSGTWDTEFAEMSGITTTDTNYLNSKMGQYYTVGELVHIDVRIFLTKGQEENPTTFTDQSLKFKLPFMPKHEAAQSENVLKHGLGRHVIPGWFRITADLDPSFDENPAPGDNEQMIIPAFLVLRTSTSAYGEPEYGAGYIHYVAENEILNSAVKPLVAARTTSPANLVQASIDGNSTTLQFYFSGMYRREI